MYGCARPFTVFLNKGGDIIQKKLQIQEKGKWKKEKKTEKRREKEKARIRAAYSNVTKVEIIPAKYSDKTDDAQHIRVAAYCRVSTYEDAQAVTLYQSVFSLCYVGAKILLLGMYLT